MGWSNLCSYTNNANRNYALCNIPANTHAWRHPGQYNPGFVCGKVAGGCTAYQVANSNYAKKGSITGSKGTSVTVKCSSGFTGGGKVTCGSNGKFTTTTCKKVTSCGSTKVANSNKKNGTGKGNSGTGDLGDGVAVLDLDGDLDDLGVVNAVLGGDLTASVLHSLGDGVGNSVGNGKRSGSNGDGGSDGVSQRSSAGVGEVLGISLSIGLSLPLADVVGSDGSSNGSVTESVDDLSADLLVLNLLGGDGLGGADLLGSGGADLGDQDHILGDTVRGRGNSDGGNGVSQRGGNVVASVAEELGVSLSISVSSRGSASKGGHTGKGENLSVHIELDDFPRWFELK